MAEICLFYRNTYLWAFISFSFWVQLCLSFVLWEKSALPSTAASEALITANGDLKRKLDYFVSFAALDAKVLWNLFICLNVLFGKCVQIATIEFFFIWIIVCLKLSKNKNFIRVFVWIDIKLVIWVVKRAVKMSIKKHYWKWIQNDEIWERIKLKFKNFNEF